MLLLCYASILCGLMRLRSHRCTSAAETDQDNLWLEVQGGTDGRVFMQGSTVKKVFYHAASADTEEVYLKRMHTSGCTPNFIARDGNVITMSKVPGISLKDYLARVPCALQLVQQAFLEMETSLRTRSVDPQDHSLQNYIVDAVGSKVYRIDFGKASDMDESSQGSVLAGTALKIADHFPGVIEQWKSRLQLMPWNKAARSRLKLECEHNSDAEGVRPLMLVQS